MVTRFGGLVALALAAGGAACSSDSAGPGGGSQVSFSVATAAGGNGERPSPGGSDTVAVGADVLVLERIEMVLREIELRRAAHDDCDSVAGDDDACEELSVGPLLLDLPLGPGAARQFEVEVAADTYERVEFEVHKPEDDPGDDAFLRAHPDLEDVSIRVTGTYNGTPFVFTTDLNAEQELALTPPLAVEESGAAGLTLFVDVRGWFVSDGGLVDPALALEGGPFEAVVRTNIESSLEVFADNDHDGASDD